jgi:MoxR-like ATPase
VHLQNLDKLQANINQIILGKEDQVELLVATLLAGGHLLLEDIPGTGKTTLAKALIRSIRGDFSRVQFTPDLLPSDILGSSTYHPSSGTFNLEKGPLFCHLFLADEINRAAPRTQSALLEAMAEEQITLEGKTLVLDSPFMVIATQNTMESEGVFPLPEAQLDRFMLKTSLGYPEEEDEFNLLTQRQQGDPLETLQEVMTMDELKEHKETLQNLPIHEDILKYLLHLIRSTRTEPRIQLGASPRTSLGLMKFSQALSYLRGKDHVGIDEIQTAWIPVLSHRIFLFPGERSTQSPEDVLSDIIQATPVPR